MLRLSRLIRNDHGNVMVTVTLVSLLVGALAGLVLQTANQADVASARDRNHEVALGVAEAGVHEAIARIEATLPTSYVANLPEFTGSTDEGTYTTSAQRVGDTFVVDSVGRIGGGGRFERNRRVRVTLAPPELFPDAGYALFSSTNLYLKNNNEIYDGDIWSNDSLWIEAGAVIEGSITAAQSWIRLEQNTTVEGYVWAGGRNCEDFEEDPDPNDNIPPRCIDGWGINQTSGTIGGWAKSSVSAPNCASELPGAYAAEIGGSITGDLTLIPDAPRNGTGTVGPPGQIRRECTVAPAAKPAPVFVYNKWNYDPSTFHEFTSAQAFITWLDGNKAGLRGTFVIDECSPDTAPKIDLDEVTVGGNVTIITNPPGSTCPGTGARIDTNDIGQAPDVPDNTLFVVVSHYKPPAGTVCTDQDDEHCAIVAKNHFAVDCKVSSLLYADNGPVAMKNNSDACGSVIAAGIQMKNGLKWTYDPIFERLLGFGPTTYEIAYWQELPVT